MIKFKDLYVSLASEQPVEGGGWPGGLAGLTPLLGYYPVCEQGQPSQTTPICNPWTPFTPWSTYLCWSPWAAGAVPVVPNAMGMSLKDYLHSALEKSTVEAQAIEDMETLDRLEDKMTKALEEVRARKQALGSQNRPKR